VPTLNWIGKDAVVRHHKEVPFRLLESDKKLSHGDSTSGNLIVEGDNLHALKALLPRYAGKVKCICIDPPYNTGNEGWVYNDNVNAPEILRWLGQTVGKEAEDLSRHDKWLCMMYPRLVLLKQFLNDDGSIWVCIDDNEVASLRMLLDEIFGRRCFVTQIVWQARYSRSNDASFSLSHNHILVYATNPDHWRGIRNRLPRTEEQTGQYKNPDNDPRGSWRAIPWDAPNVRENLSYGIKTPTGKLRYPPTGRCWSRTEDQWNDVVTRGLAYFGKSQDGAPSYKMFLSEAPAIVPNTWWPHSDAGHTDEAKKELFELFSGESNFGTPKPSRLIDRILQIATNPRDIVMDSFAGSGTTAHAVLKQNAGDGGNRKFILVEMESGICKDITAERVRRVAGGYTNAKGEKVEGLGGGFQYCRLSKEPLFDATGAVREDVRFAQLAEFVWFAETGTGFVGKANSPLLGVHQGVAVYLLYNGILKDKSVDGGNVLTASVLALLPPHDGPKMIYASASRLGAPRLQRERIVFKQTPYALDV